MIGEKYRDKLLREGLTALLEESFVKVHFIIIYLNF